MTDTSGITVERVKSTDRERAIDTIVLAFEADPLIRWLFSTPQEYLEEFPPFVERYAGAAFDADGAYHVHDFAGVALWEPPGTSSAEGRAAEFLSERLEEAAFVDLGTAFEQVNRSYPDDRRWHLPFVGVDPFHQGSGYGSRLLEHVLTRCDQENVVATLESTNPRNLSLYARHGFELCETIQIGDVPPIYPMVRTPRSHEDTTSR